MFVQHALFSCQLTTVLHVFYLFIYFILLVVRRSFFFSSFLLFSCSAQNQKANLRVYLIRILYRSLRLSQTQKQKQKQTEKRE